MIRKITTYLFLVLTYALGLQGAGTPSDQKIISLHKNVYDHYKIIVDPIHTLTHHIQSLSHCLHPEIRNSLFNSYSLQQKIISVGEKAIEHIINMILVREQELADTHYVFYHGCKIEFLLFQDLLKHLTEIIYRTTLNDFFLLRTPDSDYDQFHTVHDFLRHEHYTINDSIEPARKLLLSVNPSLFGNSIYRETSSAFCYFLNSKTAFPIPTLPIIKSMFNHYGRIHLYNKYESKIEKLNTYLTTDEKNKTGILLQIFIPKEDIDTLVYRSLPRGVPYYGKSLINLPSLELFNYQRNNTTFKSYSGVQLDEMQFRILLDSNHMLNSHNDTVNRPIKIFRYYNQTPDIKTYRKEIQQLKDILRMELL